MPLPGSLTTTRMATRSKHAVAELAGGRYDHRLNLQLDTPVITHRLRRIIAQVQQHLLQFPVDTGK